MNKMIQKATVVLGVALIAFSACKKDNVQNIVTATDETALVAQAGADMDNVGVYSDNNNANIYMDNDGIAAEFLVEEVDGDLISAAAGGGADDSVRNRIREHSFIRCLHGLSLTDTQKLQIRMALRNYAGCKEAAVKRARAIYAELQKLYRAKAEKYLQAYKAGKITKDELETAMRDLRIAFKKELRAKHLDEKLDAAMKACFGEFVGKLHHILSEEQWKAFVKCHRR